MNIEKIYFTINNCFDTYLNEGIKADQFLNYLNTNQENFEYMYNRIYRKLKLDNIQFDSDTLKKCMIDTIRDKIYLLNDIASN